MVEKQNSLFSNPGEQRGFGVGKVFFYCFRNTYSAQTNKLFCSSLSDRLSICRRRPAAQSAVFGRRCCGCPRGGIRWKSEMNFILFELSVLRNV